MKSVILLSALACATLASPVLYEDRLYPEQSHLQSSDAREKKSPTFKHHGVIAQPIIAPIAVPVAAVPYHGPIHQPLLHHGFKKHHGLFRDDGASAEQIIQHVESGNQQDADAGMHMAKAAFDNLESDLNKIENTEKSANIEKARQALDDARKSFAELEAMRVQSAVIEENDSVPTTELRKSVDQKITIQRNNVNTQLKDLENERSAQWKDHKASIQRKDETPALSSQKNIEMEESASSQKEFRAPIEAGQPSSADHFNKKPEATPSNKQNNDVAAPKAVETPINKNAEISTQTWNRNNDLENIQHLATEKQTDVKENSRSSVQSLEVPQTPQQTELKAHFTVAAENKNGNSQVGSQLSMKSAVPVESKWSSSKSKHQVAVQGKSAESELLQPGVGSNMRDNSFASSQNEKQFLAPIEKSAGNLPMKMREEDDFMRETNMQWKHSPQSNMRSSYGALSGASYSSLAGGPGAIGVFPNAHVSNCAIPLLLSCSPSVVPGSLGKSYSSYGASSGYGSYRSEDSQKLNQPAKRNAKNLNRIEMTKTKRTAPKDSPMLKNAHRRY